MRRLCWILAAGICLDSSTAFAAPDSTAADSLAGASGTASRATAGPWWIGVWAGAALNSRFETRFGSRDRDFYVAGIRLGRQLSASPRFAVDYFIDVVPLLRSTNMPIEYRDEFGIVLAGTEFFEGWVMETATVNGYGVSPVGLQVRAFPRSRVQLTGGFSAGVALYERQIPDPKGRKFNFMGEISAGVEIRTGRAGVVLAGIRHNHTSNANTARVNTGLDSRVAYLGVTRSLGRPSQP